MFLSRMVFGLDKRPNTNDSRINVHEVMGNCSEDECKEYEVSEGSSEVHGYEAIEREDDGDEEREELGKNDEHEGEEHEKDKEDEESDISDSEINEYKEAVYKLLKFRTYKIKGPNGQLRCPFCYGWEKHEYNTLLKHAIRVGEDSRESAKQRANHFAMARYLVIDLDSEAEQQAQRTKKILCNLDNEIDVGKENFDHLQSKYVEKTTSIHRILEERDETHRSFFEEARNMLGIARDHLMGVLDHQEMLNFEFENKRRQLNSWSEELNKHEAALTNEKTMDDLVREKNDLLLLYQNLLAKEHVSNDELHEAHTELVKGLEDMPSHCRVNIGVKRRSSHDAVSELWNFEKDRKASSCEVIKHVFAQWKVLQCKIDKIDEVIRSLF